MNYIIGFAIGCIVTFIAMCKFAGEIGIKVMEKVYEDVEKQDEMLINSIRNKK